MPCKVLMELDNDQRRELMAAFRVHVPDTAIAKVFGTTRQNIGQVLGPRTSPQTRAEKKAELAKRIKAEMGLGHTVAETWRILRDEGLVDKRSQVTVLVQSQGIKRSPELRMKQRRARIKAELKEFIKTGLPFQMGAIEFWSSPTTTGHNLISRMKHITPYDGCQLPYIEAWAEALKVTPAPKFSRLITKKEI